MQVSEEEVMTRELKVVIRSAAGVLYLLGLTNIDIYALVEEGAYTAFKEQEENAPTTKIPKLNALDNEQVQEITDAQAETNQGGS